MSFTDNLKKKLTEKGLTESTAAAYIRQLKTLNNNSDLSNLNFLKATKKVLSTISTKSHNTQKGYLSAVISVIRNTTTLKGCLATYQKKLDSLTAEKPISNVKSERQKKNWIDWSEVEKVFQQLQAEISKFKNKKQITPAEFTTLQKYAVLSLYVLNQPRRNKDYKEMYVVNHEPTDKSHNYLVLKGNTPSEFVYNVFKTAKSYGQQKFPVPPELATALKQYLAFHPLADGDNFPLLVYPNGQKFDSDNNITRLMNRIFHRNIGPSMLRHIYLTHKYGNELKEMKEDAEKMGHSLNEQREYIVE